MRLYSRPGNDLTYRFPLIVESLAPLRSRSCIIDGGICEARVGSSRHVAWVLRVIRFGLDAAPCKRGLMTSRNVSQVGNYNSVRRFKIALQSGWQR